MMIAVGCDHGGFEHKNAIAEHLKERGFEVVDYGIHENVSVDYPDIASKLCEGILGEKANLGILVCGTGIGMSLAANKIKGIRASLCADHFSTKYTRLHNDANIMCMGARTLGVGVGLELAEIFVDTPFEGGRHALRVDMIREMEEEF